MLVLKRTALVCASEENADNFYQKLLGLEKVGRKTLPRTLSAAIFNVNRELRIINYIGEMSAFEIFIDSQRKDRPRQIEHTCIEIEDRITFLNACQDLDVEINLVKKEEKALTFIQDFDGNLFGINRSCIISNCSDRNPASVAVKTPNTKLTVCVAQRSSRSAYQHDNRN